MPGPGTSLGLNDLEALMNFVYKAKRWFTDQKYHSDHNYFSYLHDGDDRKGSNGKPSC